MRLNQVSLKVKPILNSYAEIFFLQGSLPGFLVLLISFLHPHAGAAGVIAILSAYLFARFIGYHAEFLTSGYYTYNPLLVGLSIGTLFEISLISIPFIAIAAMLTFIVTISLANVLYRYFQLQILSIPFVIVSSLIYLAASRFTNLYVNDLYTSAPLLGVMPDIFPSLINGFLKSMGAIVFMPNELAGLLIIFMIFLSSGILVILAFLGFVVGTTIQGAFTGSFESAFHDIAAFNYSLIAMALGGVFNIPSIQSFALAMVGVSLSTVLIKSTDVFWSQYGVPAFTLPFTFITLGIVYVLGLLQYPLRPLIFKSSPEHTAEYFHTAKKRYAQATLMHLPILDKWSVWQGFDGDWTHKGLWKYAIDFVKTDAEGKTYYGEGKLLSEYYCYHKEVCSPVRGYVVHVASHFIDNPIGSVDTVNNWGNHVVIQDQRGNYVSLCHLAQHHVYVKAGDWVEPYQVIGLCGNSGYSPQPHIHMQHQVSSYMTSATIPFSFEGLVHNGQYLHHAHLVKGDDVSPIFTHAFYNQATTFLLGESLDYDVYKAGKKIDSITLASNMAFDGTFYLEHSGSQLYLGRTDTAFYFYHLTGNDPFLKLFYKALPSLPLNYLPHHSWEDFVPSTFLYTKWQQLFLQLKSAFSSRALTNNARYTFTDDTTVKGVISPDLQQPIHTLVKLDPYGKLDTIEVGDIKLVRQQQVQHEQ